MKSRFVYVIAMTMSCILFGCGGGDDSSVQTGGQSGGQPGGGNDTSVPAIAQPSPGADTPVQATDSLASYVNTMRGANSNGDFTRGNTYPAVAVPFGFNFWTPINRDDTNWFYQFYEDEANLQLLNKIMGFGVVHMPSPWIGNRQSLQIMPASTFKGDGSLDTSKSGRAQSFDRRNEIAKAHYYSVTFDNGMRTEITPTDHAAVLRFTTPDTLQSLNILFDVFDGGGKFSVDAAKGVVSGYTDQGSNEHVSMLYYYARFDKPIASADSSNAYPHRVTLDSPAGANVINLRIATSFISVEQAMRNLDQEIGGRSFDQVKALAESAWNDKLGLIEVGGATQDQKVTLYSNMYRAFLYPNSAWENVDGMPTYMSPYTPALQRKTGKIWVNNGFWDTYRTTWPLYALLMPTQAGEMIDGFVNGFKDGGWVTRWSGPGYNDSMVATSSDVIFADAYLKGVGNFDTAAAYASMLRNATTYSDDSARGRKAMNQTPFYGYMPSDNGNESVSWSLEAYLDDFGIAQMAKALNKPDDYAYFIGRAQNYAKLFQRDSNGNWAGNWFRAKDALGRWSDADYGPDDWGYGYTEGNAWSYKFLVPQDGQGLATLFGGRAQLKRDLDAFFAAPTYLRQGSYWKVIHEIKEANRVNELAHVGQYQHSNQPVHHSLYMYNYAGAPAEGQRHLRDVMTKLYTSGLNRSGIPDGSGYIGDEDNGEMSAWYLFSAMGFYPVSVGRPEYAIGAPFFPKMIVHLQNGKRIVINAPGVSDTNRYVQGVRLNGQDITRNYLLHSDIANGGTLDFVMGSQPSSWGTGENDVPSSITQGNSMPKPFVSLMTEGGTYSVTASTTGQLVSLNDRNSSTSWQSGSGADWIEASVAPGKTPGALKVYTLTSAARGGQDPANWTLEASDDGTQWVTLDQRKDERFAWRQQTRPFAVKNDKGYAHYRIRFGNPGAFTLAEVELLAQ